MDEQHIKVEAATEPLTQTESVLDKIKGILPLAFTSLARGSSAPETQTQEPVKQPQSEVKPGQSKRNSA